jgi:hypothetical protein
VRRRLSFVFAPLVVVGLLLAGCGGSDSDSGQSTGSSGTPSGDAGSILAAIKPVVTDGPQKIGLKLAVDLNGTLKDPTVGALLGDGSITVDLNGPVDAAGKAADLTFAASAGKINLAGGVRLAGDKAFLKLGEKWYALPVDALNTATTGAAQNVDPAKILAALGNPSDLVTNATVLGSEDIEGIDTDHVGGTVDTAALVKAIARISSSLGDTGPISADDVTKATKQLEEFVKDAKIELWVGKDDKQVHRFKLDVTAVLDAATKESSGLDGFALSTTITATPTSAPDVSAPADAGTIADLQNDIGPIILQGLGGATP